ncbi:hypothetical protein ACL02R_16645 [Streptomyces sp. MS19]|uniref:hypothetical protein n=1 Tax=Streptomyces sp. MS19 TaxID=3385972 RepID=UPI0039A16839
MKRLVGLLARTPLVGLVFRAPGRHRAVARSVVPGAHPPRAVRVAAFDPPCLCVRR